MRILCRSSDKKGVTLIENLVGILLLSVLLIGVMGAYYLSLSSVSRGKHFAKANSILQSYMAQEMQAGYSGGSLGGAYYATMNLATNGSVSVTIDDKGTASTTDDLMGTISASPWYPDNIQTTPGNPLNFDGVRYKIVGFVVSWVEKVPIFGGNQTCSVRTASYVCEH